MKKSAAIYIVGDSISIQYGPFLQQMLEPDISYARKSGEDEARQNLDIPRGANGGDSAMVRAFLEALQSANDFHKDILLVNCGLHDIKKDPVTGVYQVNEKNYRANLQAIITLGRRLAERFIWIETTPVDDAMHARRGCGFQRFDADRRRYNAIADEVMAEKAVPVIRLGRFTGKLGSAADIFKDGVHFLPPVQQQQAAFIAGCMQP